MKIVGGEAWVPVPIPEFAGNYSVSDQGRVRRDAPGRGSFCGRILVQSASRSGYLGVSLSSNNRSRRVLVAHLVCAAFGGPAPGQIGTQSEDWQVDHIDFVRTNNVATNLRWLRCRDNRGKTPRGENHYAAKLTAQQVSEIRSALQHSPRPRHRDLAAKYGVGRTTIGMIANGRIWRDKCALSA